MLKRGKYIAEHDNGILDQYRIVMSVRETEKSYVFELLRLTVAELIFLREHKIRPEPRYLHSENRQALVEAIYTKNTIVDNCLEQIMECAECRDETVRILLVLLKKKKLIVL